jgi:Flp pilus assembly protein TadG
MLEPYRSDRSLERLVKTRDLISTRRRRSSESGQATVEFALILFPLLLLVVGVIQFGIGLNYWLDMNRIANQGARFAVVNAWPGCERTDAANSCINVPACTTPITAATNQSLANYLKCQTVSQGLRGTAVVSVCYQNDGDSTNDGQIGSPVRVRLQAPFSFAPIVNLGTISLRADATMRLEQNTDPALPLPSLGHLSGVVACP